MQSLTLQPLSQHLRLRLHPVNKILLVQHVSDGEMEETQVLIILLMHRTL